MNILRSLKEIIIVFILQYLLVVLCGVIYSLFGYDINNFMGSIGYFIVVIFNIIVIILLNKRYKLITNKVSFSLYFPYIYLIICYALIMNNIFFIFNLTNSNVASINIILLIISSGVIGPVVEELLFRGILFNNLNKYYSNKKSILISSLIFGLFHTSINGFIYAFFLGIILSYIYLKANDIKICMLGHMLSNILVLFLSGFNLYILLLSIYGFILSGCLIYKLQKVN